MVPSVAAETVPEYIIFSPTFAPLFIPDIKISGFFSRSAVIASLTQSAGVPSTE